MPRAPALAALLAVAICVTPARALAGAPPEAEAPAAEPDPTAEEPSEPDATADEPAEPDATAEEPAAEEPAAEEPAAEEPAAEEPGPKIYVPRVDGGYFGMHVRGGVATARLMSLETGKPFAGAGFGLRVGDVVYDWMTIGLDIEAFFGNSGAQGGQQLLSGQLLIDFGFLPIKRVPFSLRAAFGFGGGRVNQSDGDGGGFGGAAFRASARHEFFPRVERYRARRGGGLGIGPELGWTFNSPSKPGGPLAHTITLGFSLTWYRGR